MSEQFFRKERKTYVFAVEGKTEAWYLEWLARCINETPESNYTVSIVANVRPDLKSTAKKINAYVTPSIVCIYDYEGKGTEGERQFLNTLDQLSDANRTRKGSFRYELGYSNLTFELWMILHKGECNRPLTDKKEYLDLLNKVYGTRFESLEKYKVKGSFNKILDQLTLGDVKAAIGRADKIMSRNKANDLKLKQYKGFKYYEDNPSLTIGEPIKRILKECGLL